MIPEIKKMLYAIDLSENARYSFGYAASLANRYGAGLTVLHVLEELAPNALAVVSDFLGKERWEDLKKETRPRFSSRSETALRHSVMRQARRCPHLLL